MSSLFAGERRHTSHNNSTKANTELSPLFDLIKWHLELMSGLEILGIFGSGVVFETIRING
jgi:hypothetical protein